METGSVGTCSDNPAKELCLCVSLVCNYGLSGVVPGIAKPEIVQSALCFNKRQLMQHEIREAYCLPFAAAEILNTL